MWLALILFLLANVAVSTIGALIPALNKYTIVLLILLTFVTGSYGNIFYRRQIAKLVASDVPTDRLGRKGGTSPIALIVAIALSAGMVALTSKPMLQQIQAARQWRRALAGTLKEDGSLEEATQAGIWITTACVRAVDACFALAGGSAVYDASPLQRRLRDMHVAAQHAAVHQRHYLGAGKRLLRVSSR